MMRTEDLRGGNQETGKRGIAPEGKTVQLMSRKTQSNSRATSILRVQMPSSTERSLTEFKKKLNFKDDKAEKGEEKDPAVVTQSDEAPTEEDLLGPNCYYDKSKSFFDNISFELETSSRRTTWAEERKLNMETFGVSGRFLCGRSSRGGF